MLKSILNPKECASCKFCCSFRRQSMWETPLFTKDNYEAILKNHKEFAEYLIPNNGDYYTYDLSEAYKTDDENEEAACPFLDAKKGCILGPDEKPWDCSIWPFRVVKKDDELWLVLTPTCREVNKVERDDIDKCAGLLADSVKAYVTEHPCLIKEYIDDFFILIKKL